MNSYLIIYNGNKLRRTLWLKESKPAKLGLFYHLNATRDIWLIRILWQDFHKGCGGGE